MGDFLKYEQYGSVVMLTMNNPGSRNAVSNDVAVDFVEACERITQDVRVRVVILTGAGSVFSSGGNFRIMKARIDADGDNPTKLRYSSRNGIQRIPLALYGLEVPVIAAVNGPAIGAGCDIACMCDIRIASKTARFAESFVKVGLVPGDGGAWFLPRVVGMSKASEMTFTGQAIDADDALACGLVSRVVAPEALLDEARVLAGSIAANPGHALRMAKRLLREGQQSRLEPLLELSASMQAIAFQSKQHREAVTAFLEKRPPIFSDD